MKKLTLLCTRSSREQTLESLRDLGVLHLQHVTPPEGEGLDEARNQFTYLRRALEVLPKHSEIAPSGQSAHDAVNAIWTLIHRKQELTDKVNLLKIEQSRYELFGAFNVEDVRELRGQGMQIKLLLAPIKQLPEEPAGAKLIELGRDRTSAAFVLISRNEVSIEADELPLPERSAVEIGEQISALDDELLKADEELNSFSGDHNAIAGIVGEAGDHVSYLEARNGMGKTEEVTYLRGFFPTEQEETLRATAAKQGWAVLVEEPSDDDDVPTLLRNPKWVKPIKAVLGMIGVSPGYKELDISPLFLIFLSIFYAILIGDAGYGLLFIALTLFAKWKLRGNEKARSGLNLLMIMSSCTVVWGVLTGVYFGISYHVLPAPMRALSSTWLSGGGDADLAEKHVMLFCFTLGAIHLSIARIWNLCRKIKSWGSLGEAGWLCCIWMLYFIVLELVIEIPPPISKNILWNTLYAGIGMVSVSLIFQKEILGLVTLVLDVISSFVDVISYVRLYAVGAASFAIANSFNEMAVEALGTKGVFVGGLIAALCIFGGHILNIVLGAMGILVHGIRLNTLEFSSHAGVQWAGIPFKAFKKITGGAK